jgi:ankyrin repeat protein
LDDTSDDIKNAMFETILISNNDNLVKVLLTKFEWFLEAKNSHGLTPLLWALYHGRKTYFNMFLEAGANPMARCPDNGRPTALMLSIKLADLTSFQRLSTYLGSGNNALDCGMNARDDYGRTALSWCAMMAGVEPTTIRMIAEMVDRIYVDPNVEDKSGRTALMRAVESASERAVDILLGARNIKPDSGASNRSTPLRRSIIYYVETKDDVFLRISRALLMCGANFYCTKKLPTPTDIIARYDESICADLRHTWQCTNKLPPPEDIIARWDEPSICADLRRTWQAAKKSNNTFLSLVMN